MKKTFWDRTAKIYDRFMRKDHKAYKQMYSLIYPVVRHKQVLELATGTWLGSTKKRSAESQFSVDLCGVRKVGNLSNTNDTIFENRRNT